MFYLLDLNCVCWGILYVQTALLCVFVGNMMLARTPNSNCLNSELHFSFDVDSELAHSSSIF